jgi:hypothetical protein
VEIAKYGKKMNYTKNEIQIEITKKKYRGTFSILKESMMTRKDKYNV